MSFFRIAAIASFVLADACAMLATAHAQNAAAYPTRPVRIVVPFPPGQTVDVIGRLTAERLTEALGRQFIVDNRSGASGTIGSSLVARATPDGYTLLIVSNGTLAGNTALFKEKLPYSATKDFAPVINVISTPQVLGANPGFPHKTVQDLVKYAKANPGKISYASPGYGTSSHLAMEMLKARAGIDLVMVPYQGSPAAVIDIIAGQVPIMFDASVGILPFIRSGKVRGIATGGAKRASFMPELPTVAESGYPGYDATPWVGLVAPAGTPKAIVVSLYETVSKALQTPELKARILQMGAEPSGMNPQQFGEHIRFEIDRWSKVVQDAGIKLE